MKANPDIDLGLAVASVHLAQRPPGTTLSLREIAEFCNCHHSAIATIERKALKKMKLRLKEIKDQSER